MLEQGLEGLRPLQAFALRKVHSSEVSGRRRVRKDLPKLGKSAGDRRRLAENLFFVCAGLSLDDVERRRAPRWHGRCQKSISSGSCTQQPKDYARPRHRAGSMRSRVSPLTQALRPVNGSTSVRAPHLHISVFSASDSEILGCRLPSQKSCQPEQLISRTIAIFEP